MVLTGHNRSPVLSGSSCEPRATSWARSRHRRPPPGTTPPAPGTDLVNEEFRGVRGPADRSPRAQHEQKRWRQLIATQLLEIFGLGIDNGPANAIPDAAARLVHYHALRRGPAGSKPCSTEWTHCRGHRGNEVEASAVSMWPPCPLERPRQPVQRLASGPAKRDVAGLTAPLDRMVSRT